MKTNLKLWYKQSAENSDFGWENQSLPIGNGYMGANIFGIVEQERIQITENSLVNDYNTGGLNNFAEISMNFSHSSFSNYERGLNLDNAVAYVKYDYNGVHYSREYFASYPDKVLVMKINSSVRGALSFSITAEIPFIKDYAVNKGDGGGKSGTVVVENETIILNGKMNLYNVLFEGQLKVMSTNGKVKTSKNCISIEEADDAVIIFAVGTNYELSPHVFLEDDSKKKLSNISPHDKVCKIVSDALARQSFEDLKNRHVADYQNLFNRVSLTINNEGTTDLPTDELLSLYKKRSLPYLESLYFQYGRYLLISSSRKGCLPANLQGVWNCHDASPWGSGYWHNINVQMNYWPAFNTNLLETFEAYADFFKAFMPKAQKYASDYIKEHNPVNYVDDKVSNGWTIGTGSYPYTVSAPGGHSGPGTGGLTSKLFWDYYEFTRDEDILRHVSYPALLGMSRFLTKTVKDYDGKYLTSFSASPEQMLNGPYIRGGRFHQTVGCAFDQQMIYENGKDLLKAASILAVEPNADIELQRKQVDKYNPVNIGWSGQIKEYIEEKFYGEIGEYNHRHISQLIGLYPGTVINSETTAWLDAAKYTLNERGDNSTGWALAHRLNAWARTGDGNRCHKLLRELIGNRTMSNLWDTHPPFQIDGNFGGTAGIAEMLLQSHEEYISILPSLPDTWTEGEYKGLLARGNFCVDVKWEKGQATQIKVLSKKGGLLKIKYNELLKEIETKPMEVYVFENLSPRTKVEPPKNLKIDREAMRLSWEGEENAVFNVYRSIESEARYLIIAEDLQSASYTDDINFSKYETVTYKVTAKKENAESVGIFKTVNHATKLQEDIYTNVIHANI